tara:strand:+ start:883 stop:1047 length:165 start_codon:yes stop_codon:yes gene_type:complete
VDWTSGRGGGAEEEEEEVPKRNDPELDPLLFCFSAFALSSFSLNCCNSASHSSV